MRENLDDGEFNLLYSLASGINAQWNAFPIEIGTGRDAVAARAEHNLAVLRVAWELFNTNDEAAAALAKELGVERGVTPQPRVVAAGKLKTRPSMKSKTDALKDLPTNDAVVDAKLESLRTVLTSYNVRMQDVRKILLGVSLAGKAQENGMKIGPEPISLHLGLGASTLQRVLDRLATVKYGDGRTMLEYVSDELGVPAYTKRVKHSGGKLTSELLKNLPTDEIEDAKLESLRAELRKHGITFRDPRKILQGVSLLGKAQESGMKIGLEPISLHLELGASALQQALSKMKDVKYGDGRTLLKYVSAELGVPAYSGFKDTPTDAKPTVPAEFHGRFLGC